MHASDLKTVRRAFKFAERKVVQDKSGPGVFLVCSSATLPAASSCIEAASAESRVAGLPRPDSLADLLWQEKGPLSRDRAIAIVLQVCDRLLEMNHAHGGITPELLQVAPGPFTEDVELLPAQPGGLPVYSAPELASGAIADYRADVYSLGVILYEMISNKNGSAAQIEAFSSDLSKWLAHSPVWSATPSALKILIRSCLKEEPGLRFADAGELKQALMDYLYPYKRSPQVESSYNNLWAVIMLFIVVVCIYLCSLRQAPLLVAPPEAQAVRREHPLKREAFVLTAPELRERKCVQRYDLVPLSAEELQRIAEFDVAVLLDCSGSMTEFDCPLSGIVTSRWDWTARQLDSFARQTAACLPDGFTVVTFNNTAERFDACREKELAQICRRRNPSGGTRIADALALALERRSEGKAQAVIVITDGMPNDQNELLDCLANAGADRQPEKPHILFLTVGSAQAGERFLGMLSHELNKDASNNDAISMMPFRRLERMGLGHALAQSLGCKDEPRTRALK